MLWRSGRQFRLEIPILRCHGLQARVRHVSDTERLFGESCQTARHGHGAGKETQSSPHIGLGDRLRRLEKLLPLLPLEPVEVVILKVLPPIITGIVFFPFFLHYFLAW